MRKEINRELNLNRTFRMLRLRNIRFFALSAEFNKRNFVKQRISLSQLSSMNPLVRDMNSELIKLLQETELQ